MSTNKMSCLKQMYMERRKRWDEQIHEQVNEEELEIDEEI